MLGSDVIGFHTPSYAHNFLACVERFLRLPVDHQRGVITLQKREVRVVAWPIGVDAEGSRPSRARRTCSCAPAGCAASSARRT